MSEPVTPSKPVSPTESASGTSPRAALLDPIAALKEIAFWLERDGEPARRPMAFRAAAATLEGLAPDERARHYADRTVESLPGIGPSSASVVYEALEGAPGRLAATRAGASYRRTSEPLLAAIKGELHAHTDASDGGAPLCDMADAARAIGREYLVVTDHSPRLKVANGLSAERLTAQIEQIRSLDASLDGFRVLPGIEVDILPDGALDQSEELLGQLACVVASVHSRLREDADAMTKRMVAAVASPHSDILGHCTGRLVAGGRGTRPPSTFDAEVVFAACAMFGKAVEINARPERLDPPDELLALAVDAGCLFSIDTDAHAPGQLDWTSNGVEKAVRAGIDADRIVNTWPLERLLEWTASHHG